MYPRDIKGKDFINSTESAVRALFDGITAEESRYKPLKEAYESAHKVHYKDFITAELSDDFDDHQVQHKFVLAAEAKMQAYLISQSIEVLCGAVFQIAKQGMSLILDGGEKFSRGRMIGSQHLSKVIWHGRNQAMHWEDGNPTNQYTKRCFEILAEEFGPQFEFDESPRNLAWELWKVIGWSSYEDYERDIQDILKN